MVSILSAIANIVKFGENDLKKYAITSKIRANAVGDQVEYFTKDAFANTFNFAVDGKRLKHNNVFSYGGSQNHPPDIMLKNGDAFEIKKIENYGGVLALNSSPPKDRLYASDPRITKDCKSKDGGNWKEKDIFYVVGHAIKGTLKYLFFVHGLCYAASPDTYEKVHKQFQTGIKIIAKENNIPLSNTIELGKVKEVDLRGRTELRMRGMWQIKNPVKIFADICKFDKNKEFSLAALMLRNKFTSLPSEDRKLLEQNKKIKITYEKIDDPNSKTNLLDAVLIRFEW